MLTEELNYHRIEKAISYLRDNFTDQPELDVIAGHVGMSPSHFQRMFRDWAGVSPKKFLQFITLEYSKSLLRDQQLTLFDAAAATGLSGTSRLHNLFVTIDGMTPGEYRDGGRDLNITYQFISTVFGLALIASTSRGICYLAFCEEAESQVQELKAMFPNARIVEGHDPQHSQALTVFSEPDIHLSKIRLHLKATPFQLKVWNALLNIKEGQLSTYGKISSALSLPGAARAVGTAVGSNPVAFLIPCHRVVQTGGNYGQYRWGEIRKKMMIGWEAARKPGSEKSLNHNEL